MPISSSLHFPHAFAVNYHGYRRLKGNFPHRRFYYSFKTSKNKKYIIHIEEFEFKVFVLKFFLKNNEYSKNRFNHLTGDGEAFRILSTCFTAIIHIKVNIDDNASFGFIGARKTGEKTDKNTQRFRIYSIKGRTFFNLENYMHLENVKNSSYLILDRRIHSLETIPMIQDMFESVYSGM